MKRKIVVYYPGDKSLIFALSAFIKAGYSLYPVWRMRDLWDISAQSIVLLDLEGKELFPDLDTYINASAWKIDCKINTRDLYTADEDENSDPLIRSLRRHVSAELKSSEIAEALNADIYPRDPGMLRYYCALKASFIKAENTEDPNFHSRTLESIAKEIAFDSCYTDIDLLANFSHRVEMATESAFSKLSTSQDMFNIPGRQVAYGYLSNISPWLDLRALHRQAKNAFPYLCIVQYRKKDRELTWIGSDSVLDLEMFFDLPDKGKHEILLEGSHRYITRLLKSKILEITT